MIFIDHRLPGGSLEPYGEVQVKLLTGGSYGGSINGKVISGTYRDKLNEDGYLELDLEPNADMDVLGTVWRVKVVGSTWFISLPDDGDYALGDASIQAHPTPQTQVVPGMAATVEVNSAFAVAPGDPPTVENVGTPFAALLDFGIPPSVDADDYGIDVPGGLASHNALINVAARGIDPASHGADPEAADNSVALQAAVDEAIVTGAPLLIFRPYTYEDTLTWDSADGYLTIEGQKAGAPLTHTGTGYAWDLNMDAGAAGLPTVNFRNLQIIGNGSGAGGFWGHDVRIAVFDRVEVDGYTAGVAWRMENEGRWTERNEWNSCSSRDNQQAIFLDLHTVAVTHKATASGTATLTVGTHRFIVGDRVEVELDTPDADYDGTNRQITAITSTTISFTTAGGNESTTAATGTVYAKGSFARTVIKDLFLQGGSAGYAHVEMHERSGPYDSVFDGVRGNIAEDSVVFALTERAMGGSEFSNLGVERQSTGIVSYFRVPSTWTGRRPLLNGAPRLTANEFDTEGVQLYEGGTPPPDSPWYPHPMYGGVDCEDGYIKTDLGVIHRRYTTTAKPALTDWDPGSNPEFAVETVQDNTSEARFAAWYRTQDGFRGASLSPLPPIWVTSVPTTGAYVRGQRFYNLLPAVGQPDYWVCTTSGDFSGTPPVITAAPNL